MFKRKKEKSVNVVEAGINNINMVDNKKDIKNKPYYLLLSFVVMKMKEDKLYFLSFIITLFFLVFSSFYNIYYSEGLYGKNEKDEVVDKEVSTNVTDEILDIKDYVGVYSKEVFLDIPLDINNSCSVSAYKIAYQIKKDKSISKFFINDCVGSVPIWEDKLTYVSEGGARYISANSIKYLFSATSMKEVDGDTFKIDTELKTIKNNFKINNLDVYFENNGIILMTKSNLYLINGDVGINVLKDYENSGGDLDRRIYKSQAKRQFNFIVFNNEEKVNCYDSIDDVDDLLYKIYTIKYDIDTNSFNKPKEVLSRNKSAGCSVFDEDLLVLTK
jgi:hypothetical protein